VGYEERDPIRKDDSWRSFHEVMCLAKSQDVDMVLLAGDLFHDNKPSRKAMYQVMRSLRMNCLGDKPCELEMLSDAAEVFDGAFNHVNYEDPDINVAIPVFSIHGNHDDPSGDGHYCSLDLLQVSGLLNYFGRTPESDNIQIKPVLLQKGQTKLALYGMSNVRDERLFRTFRDGKVTFFKPGVQQEDWFNLMAVHQNHHAHSETGYLPENFLPEFMDLIVWGHEHECLIDPKLNPETMFHVMQPGSSVATSLVPGEAVAKHVAIVNVTGRDFTIEKHRIKTVRPFITKEIVLAEDKRFKGLDKKKDNKQELTRRLMAIVEELIVEARREWLSIQEDDVTEEDIPLPLIRLKVEYTAPEGGRYECENPQRFSNRFVGKVANVNDVIAFWRRKTGAGAARNRAANGADMPEESVIAQMNIDTVKVSKLVKEFLDAQSLKILPQAPFGDAVSQFVDKDDKHAMQVFVDSSLENQVKTLLSLEDDEEDLESAMARYKAQMDAQFQAGTLKLRTRSKRRLKPRPDGWDSDMDGEWEDQPGAYELSDAENPETEDAAPAPPNRRRGARAVSPIDGTDDVFADPVPAKKVPAKRAAPARKAPEPKKAAARKPAARAAASRARNTGAFIDDDDDIIMLDAEPEPTPAPPSTRAAPRRAAAAAKATPAPRATRQSQLNFSQAGSQVVGARARQPAGNTQISEDEISDDDDAFEPVGSVRSRRR
jgi:double-strand break repair protein MRE11